jgi:uncharacterized protein (TIGR02001 family)
MPVITWALGEARISATFLCNYFIAARDKCSAARHWTPVDAGCLELWQKCHCGSGPVRSWREYGHRAALLRPAQSMGYQMKLRTFLLTTAIVMAAPVAALAQDLSASVNVGITSDYVWRGVSQSNEEPSLSGGVDVSSGIFYAGTWLGQVDFGTEASVEWDFYAGIKPSLGPVTLDLGVLYYAYPDETSLDTLEAKVAASFEANDAVSFTGSLFYSPEVGEGGPSSIYTELAAAFDIPANLGIFDLSLAASVGNFNYEDTLDDYVNYRLGIAGATENGFTVTLAYTDTDSDGGAIYDGRFAVSLVKAF